MRVICLPEKGMPPVTHSLVWQGPPACHAGGQLRQRPSHLRLFVAARHDLRSGSGGPHTALAKPSRERERSEVGRKRE